MKKVFIFIALVLAFTQLSAQAAPKKVLTAKEVGSFISNKTALEADLEALGDSYDEYFESAYGDSEESMSTDPAVAFAELRSIKIPSEVQAIMKKHGLGDNGFEKFIVITYGFAALYLEKQIDTQLAGQEITPEMKPYVEQMKLVASQMKQGIHTSDLSLISARYDELGKVLETNE